MELPLLCNHNNLILKLHQKKIANLMKGDFLQVESKCTRNDHLMLGQFIYKLA